jgi:diguanylate cyclase (GGDEF)-like protein
MAVFLSAQLDFIFFLYGLAFILLGGVCFAILGVPGRSTSYGVLGSFAIAHGISEWLDLIALLVGDSAAFAVLRTVIMAASFALLLEFARRQGREFGLKVAGPWQYLALALLVAVGGALGGVNGANAVARYCIGAVAAIATAWVFVRRAGVEPPDTRRLWMFGAAGFGLYAIAAGAIVPAAPFWPANVLNYGWFTSITGLPIQLVRGLLACWITIAVWLIWKRMVAADVDSMRYTASQQRILVWTLVASATIIGLGWTLTEFLGGIYKHNVEEESAGDMHLLAGVLERETTLLQGIVRAAAGLPSVRPLLKGASPRDAELGQSALDLQVAAAGAAAAYVMNNSGAVVAASGAADSVRSGPPKAITQGGYQFAFDAAAGVPDYYASQPILDEDGKLLGSVVLTKSLEVLNADLSGFNRSYFLVDADGVVMTTNRQDLLLRALWPLPAAAPKGRPMVQQEIKDGTWINVDGQRHFVRRRFADHSRWSLVLVMPDSRIYASRFLGIIITLLVSIMMMIYLYGRERLVRDHVELESRLNLRDVARNLQLQATTDTLTGLYNRLKFNEMLGGEIARSKRQNTPLSLMLYDVDHFKSINDSHGHQVGDAVLVQLSQLVLQRIRPTDLLARWGGEEFSILAPGSNGQMAYQAAERLRSALQQFVFDKVGTLSCSFGVAQYRDGDSAEAVLARADAALYRAKIGGRNRVELAA